VGSGTRLRGRWWIRTLGDSVSMLISVITVDTLLSRRSHYCSGDVLRVGRSRIMVDMSKSWKLVGVYSTW
jgi:hypothetical protein